MTTTRKVGARLGLTGYATILRLIQREPATTAAVCEAQFAWMNTARMVLRRMHALQLIHVGAWLPRTAKCKGFTPIWHFGPGPDVPYPDGQPRRAERANNITSGMVAFAQLIRTLGVPSTKAELAERTGLSEETIRVVLDHARKIDLVRIAGWQPTEGDGYPAALWQLGSGPNATRPKPKPRAMVERASKLRRRAARQALEMQQAMTLRETAGNASVFTWRPAA